MSQFFEHPLYQILKPKWRVWHDLYEGDHDTLCKGDYLYYHPIERKKPTDVQERQRIAEMRSDREKRTKYLNVPEIVVSLLTASLLRKRYTLDDKATILLEEYENDIDGYGTSLHSFIKDHVTESLLVYGKSIILVDSFAIRGASLQQERDLGLRPYLQCLNPLNFKDWDIEYAETARLGKYNFARYEFETVMPRLLPTERPDRKLFSHSLLLEGGRYQVQRYMTDLNDYGMVVDIDKDTGSANWVPYGDPIETDLEEIPLSVYESDSWIKDVAEETLRHYNLRSMKDSIEFAQGFQKIFVKGVDFNNPKAVSALSEFTISGLPTDGDAFAIEPVSTVDLKASIEEALENAFKIGLNQLRQLPQDSRSVQGADTIAEERDNTTALLESTIEELEAIINGAIKNFAAMQGVSDFDGKLSLNQEFSERSIEQYIELWNAFSDLYQSNEVVTKAMQRKILSKFNFTEEEKKEALVAIEKQKLKPAQNPARETLLRQIGGTRQTPAQNSIPAK